MGWRRRMLRGVLVFTGCAGIAGVAVGIGVLVWPQGEARVRVSDLVVDVRPLEGGASEFVLPVSAPLEAFPAGVRGCAPEALDWLRQAGRERIGGFAVGLRNAAPAGGVLRVTELRAGGVRALVTEPVVSVRCGPAGAPGTPGPTGSPAPGAAMQIELDTDGGHPAGRREADSTTRPFEVGLGPGEAAELRVLLGGRQDFRGTFSARVTDGSRTGVVALRLGDAPEVDRPGLGQPPALTVEVADPDGDARFRCAETGPVEPCSAAGVRARVARLWHRPELAAAALGSALSAYGCSDAGRLTGALEQVWRGFYGRDPARGDHGYDAIVRRPLEALADTCGPEVAVAALDGTGAAAAGGADLLRAALLDTGPTGAAAPEPTSAPASCAESSLRDAADEGGTRPLAEAGEDGVYFYGAFRVHACSPPYALVESSRVGTGYVLFWVLEVVDGRWSVRTSGAVAADAPAGRPLFDCADLEGRVTDPGLLRAALGPAEASAGRPLCS